jgi:hypothetical protein
MQLGAVLEVAEIIRGFLTRGQLRDAIANEARAGKLVATDADIEGVLRFALTVTTLAAAVSCVIWLVMARVTARGSRWGRIVASVLYALSVGGLLRRAAAHRRPVRAHLRVGPAADRGLGPGPAVAPGLERLHQVPDHPPGMTTPT